MIVPQLPGQDAAGSDNLLTQLFGPSDEAGLPPLLPGFTRDPITGAMLAPRAVPNYNEQPSGPPVGWQYVDLGELGKGWRNTLGKYHIGSPDSKPWEGSWWNTGVTMESLAPAEKPQLTQAEIAGRQDAADRAGAAASASAPRGWYYRVGNVIGPASNSGWMGPDGRLREGTTVDDKPWQREDLPVNQDTGLVFSPGTVLERRLESGDVERKTIGQTGAVATTEIVAARNGTNPVFRRGIAGEPAPLAVRRVDAVAGGAAPAQSKGLLIAGGIVAALGLWFWMRK
jgi:hypothetical protein